MTSEGKKTTTTVTFRLEDEDFQVKLETTSENGKVVSVSDSTQKFFDYLKSLHLVSNTEDICTWLNNSENLTISIFPISNSKYSFRIRKKAEILGLQIILGVSFQKRREAAFKKVLQTSSCLNSTIITLHQ